MHYVADRCYWHCSRCEPGWPFTYLVYSGGSLVDHAVLFCSCMKVPNQFARVQTVHIQRYRKGVDRCLTRRQMSFQTRVDFSTVHGFSLNMKQHQQSRCPPSCVPLCYWALSLAIDDAQTKRTTCFVRLRPLDDL